MTRIRDEIPASPRFQNFTLVNWFRDLLLSCFSGSKR